MRCVDTSVVAGVGVAQDLVAFAAKTDKQWPASTALMHIKAAFLETWLREIWWSRHIVGICRFVQNPIRPYAGAPKSNEGSIVEINKVKIYFVNAKIKQ